MSSKSQRIPSVHRRILKRVAIKTPVVGSLLVDRKNLHNANVQLTAELQEMRDRSAANTTDMRELLANRFISGKGLEIGALHMPLSLPAGAKVKYVDYMPVSKLRKHYPELKELNLVKVDIVDNGERLTAVEVRSQNFIIANHFLEHCQDPIGTIVRFFEILKPGGILFMAIPDKRYTFDMHRPLTKYKHLLDEHVVYPKKKYLEEHCREVVKFTEQITEKKKLNARVKELINTNYSIHQHVWTQRELVEFFYETADTFSLDLEIEAMANNIHEVVFVIRKCDPGAENTKVKDIAKHYFNNKK